MGNYVMQYLTIGTLIFFGLNLVNVMLCTMKSILTIKSTKLVASLINAITFGFYALVIKSMGNYDLVVIVACTIVANLIGVYASMWILDKFEKDKVWKVTVIPQAKDIIDLQAKLIIFGLGFNKIPITTKYGETMAFDIFTNNQKESVTLKDILNDYEKIKYHIAELGKGL